MRIDNFSNHKFPILVIEFLIGPIRTDIFEVKPDLIPYPEANCRLPISIYRLFLLLLSNNHYCLRLIPRLTQFTQDPFPYLYGGLARCSKLLRLEGKGVYIVAIAQEKGAYPGRRGVTVIDY